MKTLEQQLKIRKQKRYITKSSLLKKLHKHYKIYNNIFYYDGEKNYIRIMFGKVLELPKEIEVLSDIILDERGKEYLFILKMYNNNRTFICIDVNFINKNRINSLISTKFSEIKTTNNLVNIKGMLYEVQI